VSAARVIVFSFMICFCAFSAGLYNEAAALNIPKIAIDESLVNDPGFRAHSRALAHYVAGLIYDNRGDRDNAIAEYENALDYRDDISEIYIKLGADLLILGKLDRAAGRLERAIELNPGSIKAYLLLALMNTAKGDYERAQAMYEKALETEPENLRALSFLADLLVLQKKFSEAAVIYEKMLGISRDDAFLYFNLGVIYSKTNQLEKAEESLKKAIEIDKGYVEAQMVLGLIYEVEGNFTDAIDQYESVSELQPLSKDVYVRSGYLYYKLGQVDKAVELFRILVRLDPHIPEPYLKIFSIYVIEKEYEKAETILKEALSNNVTDPEIYASLGYVSMLTGDPGKAVEYYRIAAGKAPHKEVYKFYLGVALEKSGRREEAIVLLEKCVGEDETLSEVYNLLGYLYALEGIKLDEAADLVYTAINMDPDNGAFYDSLGWIYYKKGDLEKALKNLERAAGSVSEDPTVWDHLGDVYLSLEKHKQAAEAWLKALDLDPDNMVIRTKLKKVSDTILNRKDQP